MAFSTTALFLLACAMVASGIEARQCAYQEVQQMVAQSPDDKDVDHTVELEGEVHQSTRCAKDTDFCYALWQEEIVDNRTVIKIVAQGCWEDAGSVDCDHAECISDKKPRKALKQSNSKYCCCSENMCNVNMTDIYVPTSEEPVVIPATQYLEEKGTEMEIIIIGAFAFFGLVIGIVAFAMYRFLCHSHKPAPDAVHLVESPLLNPTYSMENLKLTEIIGRGRYGSVWKGTLHDQEVAVKVFPSHHGQYFVNEREIYLLPFMEHASLLKFFGSDERVGNEGVPEYLLVLSYAPNGSLLEYLQANPVDWVTFCRMSQSIAKGLAHLHTDVRKGDMLKPSISHRDLNSKNILVKADLSCCLCDLGFAMKIAGSKYYYNGEEQHAETKSITDVGTLRYMAPEVLEGAVNLRDCESSLKQIDVYSLGLVLWEVATRCFELHHGQQVPPYRLPYEMEIGMHPHFEQMQVLVSHNKARPLFPNTWKQGNLAICLLRETIEDCWDQDAEARLTALCVEERLQELPTLWDRHRASAIVPGTSPVNPTSGPNCMQVVIEGGRYATDNVLTGSGSKSPWAGKDSWDMSASETTAETTVTMSPIESLPDTSVIGEPEPLQPHQGRNLCMERNLIREPSEELACDGNILVDKSIKHQYSPPAHFSDRAESHALLSNDFLNQMVLPRPATPIPYVQNAVHDTGLPKQPNVPGNGQHHPPNKQSWFRDGFKRLLDKRGKSPDVRQKATQVMIAAGKPVTVLRAEHVERKKRPSSLKLDTKPAGSSLDGVKDVFSGSGGLKKARSHVKTPHDIKNGRFSLYDDRMMVCAQVPGEEVEKRIGSFPDRAWYSTSVLIDSIHTAEAANGVGNPKRKGEFGLHSKTKPDYQDSLILYDCNVSSF